MAQREAKICGVEEFLLALHRGAVKEDMATAIREVAKAVSDNGGNGSVTLKIDFKKFSERGISVSGSVKHTKPVPKRVATTFWSTDDGNVTRTNLEQDQLDIPEPAERV